MVIVLVTIDIIYDNYLTYTDVNIIFIGAPFEGKEVNGFVAITVGVMEPEKLKTEVSVNLTTKNIVGISNAATSKCKHDENYHSQHFLRLSFHSWY